uniref:Uncharacterized protein n=1 Tax=Romanomermis culicivorax TaxID=13658 RepID=A0A915JC22_ROMCU
PVFEAFRQNFCDLTSANSPAKRRPSTPRRSAYWPNHKILLTASTVTRLCALSLNNANFYMQDVTTTVDADDDPFVESTPGANRLWWRPVAEFVEQRPSLLTPPLVFDGSGVGNGKARETGKANLFYKRLTKLCGGRVASGGEHLWRELTGHRHAARRRNDHRRVGCRRR